MAYLASNPEIDRTPEDQNMVSSFIQDLVEGPVDYEQIRDLIDTDPASIPTEK